MLLKDALAEATRLFLNVKECATGNILRLWDSFHVFASFVLEFNLAPTDAGISVKELEVVCAKIHPFVLKRCLIRLSYSQLYRRYVFEDIFIFRQQVEAMGLKFADIDGINDEKIDELLDEYFKRWAFNYLSLLRRHMMSTSRPLPDGVDMARIMTQGCLLLPGDYPEPVDFLRRVTMDNGYTLEEIDTNEKELDGIDEELKKIRISDAKCWVAFVLDGLRSESLYDVPPSFSQFSEEGLTIADVNVSEEEFRELIAKNCKRIVAKLLSRLRGPDVDWVDLSILENFIKRHDLQLEDMGTSQAELYKIFSRAYSPSALKRSNAMYDDASPPRYRAYHPPHSH